MRTRARAAMVLVVLLTTALTGCGGGSSTGSDASGRSLFSLFGASARPHVTLSQALAATASAPSAHVVGSLDAGQEGSLRLDLRIDHQGDCRGSIDYTFGDLAVIGVGGRFWVHPDRAYLDYEVGAARTPAIMRAIGSKYVAAAPTAVAGLRHTCNLAVIFNQHYVVGADTDKGPMTYQGRSVEWLLQRVSANNELAAFVEPTAPHYILRLRGVEQDAYVGSVDLTVSDIGAPVGATAPTSSDIAG